MQRQHKDAEAAQCTSARPHCAPMERSEVEQMKRLFNTGFYLVEAERPFRDFPALCRRPSSQPYGPRQRAQPESETDSSDSESDLDP